MNASAAQPRPQNRRKPRWIRRMRRVSGQLGLSRSLWQRLGMFLVGAVAVGLTAVVYAALAEMATRTFHGLIAANRWLPFLVAPAGFGLISVLTTRVFRGAQGSGIPQTIVALNETSDGFRNTVLSLRIAIGKMLLTLAGLLSGASIGREGPTVQIGASIMYALSRLSPFPHEGMKRGLILAGGAAGIAAAFNAPLAGVVFAIEELSHSFSQRMNGIVIGAVIGAGIVSVALLGDYAYFGQTNVTVDLRHGWIAVMLCGSVCGLLGGLFSVALIRSSRSLPGPVQRLRLRHAWIFAALCGLVLALLGLASDNTIFGGGYNETRGILDHASPVSPYFGILKFAATVVCYMSGIPGGIFAPCLAIGAGFGQNLAPLVPQVPLEAMAILCMVAFLSGVVQAPLTAFVIVEEMTRDSSMVLPLMTASLLGYAVSRLICPKPLYKALASAFKPGATLTRGSVAPAR